MYLSRLGIESSRGCRRIMMMSMPDGVPSVLLPNLGAFGSTVWADWYFYHHTHTLHQATFTLCFLQIHFYSASWSPALWNPVHPHMYCTSSHDCSISYHQLQSAVNRGENCEVRSSPRHFNPRRTSSLLPRNQACAHICGSRTHIGLALLI